MKKSTDPILLVSTTDEAPNVFYASGFHAPDPVLFLKRGKKRYLVVPPLEAGRARQTTRGVMVRTPRQLPLKEGEARSLAGWAAALLRAEGVKKVIVSPGCPVQMVRKLEAGGTRVTVADGAVFPERERKTPIEIEKLREAQRAAVAAMRRAIACLREARINARGRLVWKGQVLTSERLRFEIECTLLQRQCHAAETIVAGGRQGADPHERGSGALRAGEPIVLDIFPRHKRTGYWGDITRTVVKGEPHPVVRGMYRAVREAQAAALSILRPGVTGDAVHQRVQEVLVAHGFETGERKGIPFGFFHGTGHGVGLDIHEGPRLAPGGGPLRIGHVVTVEPGLYDPDLGGMRIEDTVVITRSGYEPLATLAKPLCL
jgi:Xaa-Pro aminopeptidase